MACAIAVNDAAYCWGLGGLGMLANGTGGTSAPVPAPVVGGHAFASISVGGSTVCGLTTSGSALCWGSNRFGQLGIGSVDFASHPTPLPVSGGHAFTAISAGTYHACAVTAGGTTYCWGARRHGILGDGSPGLEFAPQPVLGW
jgi:alpha-tubulin suppressor-like RCC1 family protein